ncbi:replication factor A protein 2 [Ascosphaera aggregata]|nr:replication factor A protein 2 [Ascosphaera aggregata]
MDYTYDNQYTSTSYGGQGGMMGGGGFMAEGQSSQTEGKVGSKTSNLLCFMIRHWSCARRANRFKSSVHTKKSRFTKESLRPVTLKQVVDATQAHPDADFRVDEQDVSHISFVGQVRNISNLTTFNTYKIDDGTEVTEVRLWLNSENVDVADVFDEDEKKENKQPYSNIELNGYVKGFGKINSFGNRHNITATSLRPVKDMNEYHLHFLEATAVHLYLTRGLPPSKQQLQQQKQQQQEGMFGAQNGASNYGNGVGTGAGGTRSLPPMSASARRVFNLLSNSPETNEGIHIQSMSSSLGMPVNEVYKACDELTSGSLIYSTIDEETFAIL